MGVTWKLVYQSHNAMINKRRPRNRGFATQGQKNGEVRSKHSDLRWFISSNFLQLESGMKHDPHWKTSSSGFGKPPQNHRNKKVVSNCCTPNLPRIHIPLGGSAGFYWGHPQLSASPHRRLGRIRAHPHLLHLLGKGQVLLQTGRKHGLERSYGRFQMGDKWSWLQSNGR